MNTAEILSQAQYLVNTFKTTGRLHFPAMPFANFQVFMTEVYFLLNIKPVGESN